MLNKNQPKPETAMKTQSYKGVNFPIGYASFEDYVATLEMNLHIAKKNQRYHNRIPKIEKDLAEAKAALSK
jgi:hypothetical protein